MDCTWSKGKLVGLGSNTYSYDYIGRRTSKNGITYTYDSQGRLVKQSNGIEFIYDDTGVAGMIQGNALYLYEKDAQGNIISLLDSQGYVVLRYEYDAWGVCKIYNTNGNAVTNTDSVDSNPFRYRGYYYDVETGLYYLPARYYDPTTGRFISADDIEYTDPETINGLNLYAYCGNNPVMNVDPSGHSVLALIFAILGISALTGGIGGGISAGNAGGDAGDILAGVGKGIVNGLTVGLSLVSIGAGIFIGPTTLGGNILLNWGLSTLFNTVEVGVTQYKKSISDGDNVWQAFNDINNSLFANTGNILTGKMLFSDIPIYGTKISSKLFTGFNILLDYDITKTLSFGPVSFKNSMIGILTGKTGKLSMFGFLVTGYQFYNLLYAIINTPDFENSKWILY